MSERRKVQSVRGVVVSDRMNKTRVIEIKHTRQHRLYKKKQIVRERLFVHDERNQSKQGDYVLVASMRPLSAHKSFRLVKIIEKSVQA